MKTALFSVFLVLVCCSTPKSKPTPSEPPASAGTAYRVGDYVVYRYFGEYTPHPVLLREEVVARKGLKLTIAVDARRGTESRKWIQVLTDTEENQRNNRLDALYEIVDGKRVRLENKNNADAYRLSSWLLINPDERPKQVTKKACARHIAGSKHACVCRSGVTAWKGRTVRFVTSRCPTFRWTHGPSEFSAVEEGTIKIIHKVEVVESGRAPRR